MIVCLDIVGIDNKKQGILIKNVIESALQTLVPKRRNPIFIDVHIARDEDMDEAEALIHQEEDGFFFLALNEIMLDKSEDDLITCLIHEMVHVRQYLRKEINENNHYNNFEEYMNQPHEIEAYRLQEELLDEIKEKAIR